MDLWNFFILFRQTLWFLKPLTITLICRFSPFSPPAPNKKKNIGLFYLDEGRMKNDCSRLIGNCSILSNRCKREVTGLLRISTHYRFQCFSKRTAAEQREYLQKRKQKKQQRFKMLDEKREQDKNNWKNFSAKVGIFCNTHIDEASISRQQVLAILSHFQVFSPVCFIKWKKLQKRTTVTSSFLCFYFWNKTGPNIVTNQFFVSWTIRKCSKGDFDFRLHGILI